MPAANQSRREYGTGGITWLSARRVRLRIRVPGESDHAHVEPARVAH